MCDESRNGRTRFSFGAETRPARGGPLGAKGQSRWGARTHRLAFGREVGDHQSLSIKIVINHRSRPQAFAKHACATKLIVKPDEPAERADRGARRPFAKNISGNVSVFTKVKRNLQPTWTSSGASWQRKSTVKSKKAVL